MFNKKNMQLNELELYIDNKGNGDGIGVRFRYRGRHGGGGGAGNRNQGKRIKWEGMKQGKCG